MVAIRLGVSRRADACDEELQAYLREPLSVQLSVRLPYRIGPKRDSQAG